MIIYLTYNDVPSGIFSSQVIDVVKFLNNDLKTKVRLVSFISIRKFFHNRSIIKNEMPTAIILPMFPGVHRWRYNYILLKLILKFFTINTIIARSVLATHLAILAKPKSTKVVYDGRGAISAEWHEYSVVNHPKLLNDIFELEKQAILISDFRIAVSNKLVEYWKETFHYTSSNHVVIPCTINKQFESVNCDSKSVLNKRHDFALENDDVVFIYSGSIAGWQSFELLHTFVARMLAENPKHKMIFFSQLNDNIKMLLNKFPKQVICKHLNPNEVADYLIVGDYGLLMREQTVTNRVASPVKFAEYLACGLQVIISDNLGDYSDIIKKNKELGLCLADDTNFLSMEFCNSKTQITSVTINNYTKKAYLKQYATILKL